MSVKRSETVVVMGQTPAALLAAETPPRIQSPKGVASGGNNLYLPITLGSGASASGQTSVASQYSEGIVETLISGITGTLTMDVQTSAGPGVWVSILAAPATYTTPGLKRSTVSAFGSHMRIAYSMSGGGPDTVTMTGVVDFKE
jgi:hypothetical protein